MYLRIFKLQTSFNSTSLETGLFQEPLTEEPHLRIDSFSNRAPMVDKVVEGNLVRLQRRLPIKAPTL
jgi:hypothetical protein